MIRGIYLAPSASLRHRGERRSDEDHRSHARTAEVERIENVLRKSQSAHDVRSLDSSSPASMIARATRLSSLYGVSPTTKLARKGAGQRPGRKRHQQPRNRYAGGHGGSPGSSREREHVESKQKKAARRQRRTLRNALEKAGDVALRLSPEVLAGLKAFDGPPLTPSDIKDVLLRSFRVRFSTSEAEALIVHFSVASKERRPSDCVGSLTIEHGEFLHGLRRLRRELAKKQTGNNPESQKHRRRSRSHGDPEPASLPLLHLRRDHSGTAAQDNHQQHVEHVVRALAKVDRAASSYDPRRIENLRHADLSRVSTPRTFRGVLLARFDVRVDPLEQSALVSLLQEENGTVDVERFRAYFLGLIEECVNGTRIEKGGAPLPPLVDKSNNDHQPA